MTAGQVPDDLPPDVLTLTSVIDSRAHKVIDSELCAPHAVRAGRYEALCGHLVAPAPLVEADGVPCARCTELAPEVERTPEKAGRRGRGSRLRRLLAT